MIKFNYITTSFVLGTLAIIANYLYFSIAQPIIGVFYWIVISYGFGVLCFKQQNLLAKTILGSLVPLFIISIVGSLFFYLYALNNLFFILITLFLPLFLFYINKRENKQPVLFLSEAKNFISTACCKINDIFHHVIASFRMTTDFSGKLRVLILIIIYLILTSSLFYILITSSTDQAIRTPWQVVPVYFFVIFFVSTFSLIAVLLQKKVSSWLKLLLAIIHLFLISSVVLIVYNLGYGFDPFVHQATMKIILDTGTISPKPLYYIGQYSLVFYLAKLTGFDLVFIDKMLVPVLSSLLLPAVLYYYFSGLKIDYKNRWLSLISILVIPVSFLIITTPQNLANLLFIVLIILSLKNIKTEINLKTTSSPCHSEWNGMKRMIRDFVDNFKLFNILLFLNALTIFFIHPLTGIPAILFVVIYLLWKKHVVFDSKLFNIISAKRLIMIISILGLFSLPVVWLINSQISTQAIVSINTNVFSIFINYLASLELLNFEYGGQFKTILSLLYFFAFNFPLILIIIFIITTARLYKEKKFFSYFPYFICFIIFFVNYLFLKIFFNFSFLIDYERENYSSRIFIINFFFLTPFLLLFISDVWKRIELKKNWFKFVLIIVLCIGLTARIYLTYSRHDNFSASRGFSLSTSSIQAVNYINNNKNDFVVLADQQTSVAALKEFGFKKYYKTTDKGDIFYYPIPTGGVLYQYYLKMVNNKPSLDIVEQAMDLVGVDESYFVINRYWWQSDQIIVWAKSLTDDYVFFGDEDVYVFKFKAKN